MAEKSELIKKRHKVAALSNLGVGVPEGLVAVAEQAGTALVNSLHNVTDLAYLWQLRAISRLSAGALAMESAAEHKHKNDQRSRRLTYGMMSLPSAGAAGWSAVGAAESLVTGRASELNPWHAGTTAASLAVAGLMMSIGRGIKRRAGSNTSAALQREIKDFNDHAGLDAAGSAIALLGTVPHALGFGWAEQGVGAGIAAYTAWRFRPTRKNVARGQEEHHDGHDHDHNHLHVSDVWEAAKVGASKISALGRAAIGKLKERERKPARKWATALAAGATALTLAFGISGETSDHTEAKPALPNTEQAESPVLDPTPIDEPSTLSIFNDACFEVAPGDSQWNIVERQLEQVIDERPDTALINAATIFTAHENMAEIPDPHFVSPGDCITLPSSSVLSAMAETSSQSGLGQVIAELNQFPDWDQAMSAHPIYDQLEKELQIVAR